MKNLCRILLTPIWLLGFSGCGSHFSSGNPLLLAPTPTPLPCVPGPLMWDDFSSGATLNTVAAWGDGGNGATSSAVMETGVIFNGTPNSWHITANPGTAGYGCGVNILATNGAVLNAFCKTLFKFDIRCNVAATYTIRFKEDGATGQDMENWVSPLQTAIAGPAFTTIALAISTFTEDAYGDPACAGTCNNAGVGNNTIDLTAIKRAEVAITGPYATAIEMYIDNIRFE